MFLDSIALTQTLPCLAEPGKIIVVGHPSRLLDEVLPYLATLPSIIAYNPVAHTLTFRRSPGFLTLYSDRVYITQVKDAEEGAQLLAWQHCAMPLTQLGNSGSSWWRRLHTDIRLARLTSIRCCHKQIANNAVKPRVWRLPLGCYNKNIC